MSTQHSNRILIESQLSWSQRVEYSIHTSNQASDWSGSPDYSYKCAAYGRQLEISFEASFKLRERKRENDNFSRIFPLLYVNIKLDFLWSRLRFLPLRNVNESNGLFTLYANESETGTWNWVSSIGNNGF